MSTQKTKSFGRKCWESGRGRGLARCVEITWLRMSHGVACACGGYADDKTGQNQSDFFCFFCFFFFFFFVDVGRGRRPETSPGRSRTLLAEGSWPSKSRDDHAAGFKMSFHEDVGRRVHPFRNSSTIIVITQLKSVTFHSISRQIFTFSLKRTSGTRGQQILINPVLFQITIFPDLTFFTRFCTTFVTEHCMHTTWLLLSRLILYTFKRCAQWQIYKFCS